jgi:hypothetical protein
MVSLIALANQWQKNFLGAQIKKTNKLIWLFKTAFVCKLLLYLQFLVNDIALGLIVVIQLLIYPNLQEYGKFLLYMFYIGHTVTKWPTSWVYNNWRATRTLYRL